MTIPPEAIEAFFNDRFALVLFLRERYKDAPMVWALVVKHAEVALAFNEDSDPSWRKLASYTFNELKTIEAERPLLPCEVKLRSLAERIYDSEVRAAAQFGIDLFPEDTKGREAARRDLDAAYLRALGQRALFTHEGDPQ